MKCGYCKRRIVGRRSRRGAWKVFYVSLCGDCFYKEEVFTMLMDEDMLRRTHPVVR